MDLKDRKKLLANAIWLLFKAEWFADFFAKTRQQLIDRIDQALLWVINRPNGNQKTCSLERFA